MGARGSSRAERQLTDAFDFLLGEEPRFHCHLWRFARGPGLTVFPFEGSTVVEALEFFAPLGLTLTPGSLSWEAAQGKDWAVVVEGEDRVVAWALLEDNLHSTLEKLSPWKTASSTS